MKALIGDDKELDQEAWKNTLLKMVKHEVSLDVDREIDISVRQAQLTLLVSRLNATHDDEDDELGGAREAVLKICK